MRALRFKDNKIHQVLVSRCKEGGAREMIMVGAEICQGKHEMITIEISFSTIQVCHIFFRVLNIKIV